jgi:predicted phosphatase
MDQSKPITLWVLKYKRNKSVHWENVEIIWSHPSSSFVGALRNLFNQIGEPAKEHAEGGVIITKAHWNASIEIFKISRRIFIDKFVPTLFNHHHVVGIKYLFDSVSVITTLCNIKIKNQFQSFDLVASTERLTTIIQESNVDMIIHALKWVFNTCNQKCYFYASWMLEDNLVFEGTQEDQIKSFIHLIS